MNFYSLKLTDEGDKHKKIMFDRLFRQVGKREDMKDYIVRWEILINAESPTDAAKIAQEIQRDPDSLATNFEVIEILDDGERLYEIDLYEE